MTIYNVTGLPKNWKFTSHLAILSIFTFITLKNKSNSLLQTLSKQQNKIKLVLIIFEIFCHFRTDPSEIFFSADPIFEAEKSYHHPDNRQPKEKEGEEEEAQTEDKNKNEVV